MRVRVRVGVIVLTFALMLLFGQYDNEFGFREFVLVLGLVLGLVLMLVLGSAHGFALGLG